MLLRKRNADKIYRGKFIAKHKENGDKVYHFIGKDKIVLSKTIKPDGSWRISKYNYRTGEQLYYKDSEGVMITYYPDGKEKEYISPEIHFIYDENGVCVYEEYTDDGAKYWRDSEGELIKFSNRFGEFVLNNDGKYSSTRFNVDEALAR